MKVDSIDLKTTPRKKFYRAYIIGASIIHVSRENCSRDEVMYMLDRHLASNDLQFTIFCCNPVFDVEIKPS